MDSIKPPNIDSYISNFPLPIQKLLQELRNTIKRSAPEAEEVISYNMPAFKYNGILVYFAGYKKHIGFYPMASGIETFKNEISVYKWAKGSVQFPIDKPLPTVLITKIVKYRVEQNLMKANAKNLRVCKLGHKYFKSSSCPTCPTCESDKKPKKGFLSTLSSPARRALENAGIRSLKKLALYNEISILALHGIGPSSIPKLKEALRAEGLSFKNK